MLVALVAGGEIGDYQIISSRLKSFDRAIAIDGGLRHFSPLNIIPEALIGDFDSVAESDLANFKGLEMERHPADKDKSDTELAVEYAFSRGADRVALFGALGGRMDHALANLFLLIKYRDKLTIETESETLYAIYDFNKRKSRPGQRVSLFPLGGRVEGVTTKGLKWNVVDQTLDGHFFSLSNVALGESFEVSISSPGASSGLICIIENG